jgi:hypothetical protein
MCDLCTLRDEIQELRTDIATLRSHFAGLQSALESLQHRPAPGSALPEPRPYVTGRQAASYLGLSPQTLDRWRVTGDGPPFMKFGSRVLYPVADLKDWADQRRHDSTGDGGH